ncbi:MAG: DUF1553 domain-containing protein [Acidobacteriota bacterium]
MRIWLCLLASPLLAQPDGAALFESRIRPLFEAKCLSCHSSGSQPIMGGLRLDSRAELLRGGSRGPSLVEGKPADSLLLKVVMHTAGPLKMPPGPKLKDAEIADLAQWVALGAPWGQSPLVTSKSQKEKHWSLKPVLNPAIPSVRKPAWVQSPIDAFILSALETKGLSPAPPADRRTLIRRATYDLTGLPPTPAEVEAFLNDKSPDAWPRLIDRLLASPRYGERWARHWLDVARYADSNGLDENLVYKNAFRYRDYVIAAFNKDKPYDQFLREQLAGDRLPPTGDLSTELERWTATGFLSLGAKMLAEDDPIKMQMDIVDEQLDTTAKAFMGLTVGCARCHDHKFDPISTAEYYALAGIFKSSHTMDHHKVVAKWHEYVLAPKPDRDRLAAHEARIEAERKRITELTSAQNKSLAAAAMRRVGAYLRAARLFEQSNRIQLAAAEKESEGIVLTTPTKTSEKPFLAEYTFQVNSPGLYQLDLLNEEKSGGTADIYLNGVWQRQGLPPVQNRAASPESGGWSVALVLNLNAGANTIRFEHTRSIPKYGKILLTPHTSPEYPLSIVQAASRFDLNPGYLTQWIDYFDRSQAAPASPLYAWEILDRDAPLSAWANPVGKLFPSPLTTPDAIASHYEQLFLSALEQGKDSSDPGLKVLYTFLHEKFGPFRAPANVRRYYPEPLRDQIKAIESTVAELEKQTPDLPRAMGVREAAKAEDIPIHIRGSHWTLGKVVPRGFPNAIETAHRPAIANQSSGRLQLAEWLTQPDHPLTSRVMVNRLWRWHFGRGIVASVDNFGRLGDKPSHPELLDYLATRFVASGWSIKAIHRLLLLSSTYQMSSAYDSKAFETDPENISLWRMPRRRLEAESIRDGIMTASGGLRFDTGGSLLTYKDRQYVANTAKGSSVDYDRPIRSIYVPVLRSSLYDVFSAFDLPDPTMSNGDRDSTVVAPQALFMMNSSVMLNHSRILAETLLNTPNLEPSARIRLAYERALARPATNQEIDAALSFIASMQKEWNGDDKKAWQSFAKSLLASNEFIYLN